MSNYQDGLFHAIVNSNINIMMLFCSSFRRLCLTQATRRPRHVWPTQLRITLRRHLSLMMDFIHGQDFSKLSLHRQNRVWGSHLVDSRRSNYMINVWLVSPSEHGFLTSLRDLRRVGDDDYLNQSLNSPLAEDAEDSFMFSRSFAFASSWFASFSHDHNH